MQVNTNYNDIVLALDKNAEAENNTVSSKSQEELKDTLLYPDTLSISNPIANLNNPETEKIEDSEQARKELQLMTEEKAAEKEQLTAKILAQANASSEKYLELLRENYSG